MKAGNIKRSTAISIRLFNITDRKGIRPNTWFDIKRSSITSNHITACPFVKTVLKTARSPKRAKNVTWNMMYMYCMLGSHTEANTCGKYKVSVSHMDISKLNICIINVQFCTLLWFQLKLFRWRLNSFLWTLDFSNFFII